MINAAQEASLHNLSFIKNQLPSILIYQIKEASSVYEAFEIYTTAITINKTVTQQFQEQWHTNWQEIMHTICVINRNTHHYFTKKFGHTL